MIKFKSIRYWIKATWRRFNNKCILCGLAPINSEEVGPFQSFDFCRYCRKLMMHSMNYGASAIQIQQQFRK